jgi:hypothetical protein
VCVLTLIDMERGIGFNQKKYPAMDDLVKDDDLHNQSFSTTVSFFGGVLQDVKPFKAKVNA